MFFWRRRHPVSEEELSAYLDGELEGARRDRVEAHVEECAACREILGELRSVRQALRDIPRATAPRSFAVREADVHPEAAPRAVGALGRAAPLLSGVATAAVVVFGVLVGIDLTGGIQSGADDEAYPAAIRYAPEDGEPGAPMPDEEEEALSGDVDGYAPEGTPLPGGSQGTDEGLPVAAEPVPECDESAPCDDGETSVSYSSLSPTPAPDEAMAAARANDVEFREGLGAEDDGPSRMRVAEAAAAAVALVAGGSVALVWWRRRA